MTERSSELQHEFAYPEILLTHEQSRTGNRRLLVMWFFVILMLVCVTPAHAGRITATWANAPHGSDIEMFLMYYNEDPTKLSPCPALGNVDHVIVGAASTRPSGPVTFNVYGPNAWWPPSTSYYVTWTARTTLGVETPCSGITRVTVTEETQPPPTTITASPIPVPIGGTVTATWANIESPSPTDWLGLFAVGAPDWDATVGGYWLSYAYVNCTKTPSIALANGACPLPIPATLTPGLYELRLFAADGLWRLATSFSFNLIIPPASPNLPTGVVVK